METTYFIKNIIRITGVVLIAGGIAHATNTELGLGVGLFLTQIRLD